ncbi:MAG: P-type conjugative transfer protein TrbG [Desulfomonilia bacterium]|jgi:type IV secretion system protein VirB9
MKKCIITVLISFLVLSGCAQNQKIVAAQQVKAPSQKGPAFDIPVPDPVPQAKYKKVASPQLKKKETIASRKKNQDPAKVIEEANREAAQKPTEDRYINAVTIYDYMEGALYEIYSAPFHVTDIMLQPGETLTSPPAAGDTARWSLDVTTSGTGKDQRVHIFLKPHLPSLRTNIAVSTDKHIYHLECQSFNETYQAGVSWYYPKDELANLTNRIKATNDTKMDIIANLKVSDLNFNYTIKGSASWKPLRAFDDGKKVFIQFPSDIEQGELPPLFIVTRESDSQLVNYRYQKHYYIVDRLFDKALLQLGTSSPEKVYINRNKADEYSLGGF